MPLIPLFIQNEIGAGPDVILLANAVGQNPTLDTIAGASPELELVAGQNPVLDDVTGTG